MVRSQSVKHEQMLQSGHEVSGEASAGDIPEEHMVQDAPACRAHPEEAGTELWSHEQLDGKQRHV